jgi:hypothetical protein
MEREIQDQLDEFQRLATHCPPPAAAVNRPYSPPQNLDSLACSEQEHRGWPEHRPRIEAAFRTDVGLATASWLVWHGRWPRSASRSPRWRSYSGPSRSRRQAGRRCPAGSR